MAKEYIERNALIAEYDRVHVGAPGGARKLMVEVPAADVVEVKHGKWIEKVGRAKCSVCADECWADSAMEYRYCPNCGAKMDGERKEADQ